VQIRVRYVPVPVTGTVFAGTGTVWKNPTRGIPVTSPSNAGGPPVGGVLLAPLLGQPKVPTLTAAALANASPMEQKQINAW
jgi:hypothetical protein